MQKFSAFLKKTFHYTDKKEEMPDFLTREIDQALHIDWSNEKFVASCWVEAMKGKLFVLITEKRVAYKDLARLNQNLFQDMTGVEKMLHNVNLLSPGNATKLFPVFSVVQPTDKLGALLFDVINTQWIKSRDRKSGTESQTGNDIITQIERLNQLKEQGIITAQEFDQKKAELLLKL